MSSPGEDKDEVKQLLVQAAIIEVLEYVVTYFRKCIGYGNGFKIRIKNIDERSMCTAENLWFSIKVTLVGNIPKLELDSTFFNCFAPHLLAVLQYIESIVPESHFSVQNHIKRVCQLYTVSESGLKVEHKSMRENPNCRNDSIAIHIRIYQSRVHMIEECQGLYNYLHKLKLFYPEMLIYFHLKVGTVISTSDFWSHGLRSTVGQRKLAVEVKHFMKLSSADHMKHRRIYPKCGTSYTLVKKVTGGIVLGPYKLTVIAATVPPLRCNNTLTSDQCSHLQILMYGPGNMPLGAGPDICNKLPLKDILNLEDYGLQIDEIQESNAENEGVIQQDFEAKLTVTESDSLYEEPEEESVYNKYRLQLFVMFGQVSSKYASSSIEQSYTDLKNLRDNLCYILFHHKTRVKKAICSALNKLLSNTSNKNDKQALLEGAIDTITNAVGGIITQSTNQNFRKKCRQALRVQPNGNIKEAFKSKLWNCAEESYSTHDVYDPGTYATDEPYHHGQKDTTAGYSKKTQASNNTYSSNSQSQLNCTRSGLNCDQNVSSTIPNRTFLPNDQFCEHMIRTGEKYYDNFIDSSRDEDSYFMVPKERRANTQLYQNNTPNMKYDLCYTESFQNDTPNVEYDPRYAESLLDEANYQEIDENSVSQMWDSGVAQDILLNSINPEFEAEDIYSEALNMPDMENYDVINEVDDMYSAMLEIGMPDMEDYHESQALITKKQDKSTIADTTVKAFPVKLVKNNLEDIEHWLDDSNWDKH